MMAKVSPHHVEASVRRSARKRRTPGEWWKEFSIEEEASIAPTVCSQQDVSLRREVRETLSSTRPDSSQSTFREEPLQSTRTSDGYGKGPCTDSSHKRRSFQNKSANKDGNETSKPDMEKVASRTGKETISQSRPDECHATIDNRDLEQQDQSTPNRNQESPSRVAIKTNSYTSHPSAPHSRGGLVTKLSATTRHPASFSDKSSLTTGNPSSFLASFQTNADEAEPLHRLSGHRDGERHFAVDTSRMETDQEMRCERNQSDHARTMNSNRSRQRMDENEGMEGYEDEQKFASARVLTAGENVKEGLDEWTPQPPKRLFSKDPAYEFNRHHRDFSKLRAPRKSRSKPDSPSYSFSLRSRHGSPDYLTSVQKLSRNQQTSGEVKRNRSRYMQQKALVAKRSTLMYNLVPAYVGTVKVAISISLNKTTMGEVLLLPRSATGPRRALTGDEFYIVKQGYVECDIGFMSITLFAGDHLGIPEGQSFEIRNPSASKSELVFFSPRSLLN